MNTPRTLRARRGGKPLTLTLRTAEPSTEFENGWWQLLGDLWPRNQKKGAPAGAPNEEREDDSRTPRE